MNRLKVSALVAALTVFAPLAALAQATDVAGAWDVTLSTPQGDNNVNITFKQDGDKITGILATPMGEVPLTGTATAGNLKVAGNFDAGGTALEMTFTAKVTGDALAGTVKFGDFGEFPFSGKRGAAAAAPAATAAAPAAGAPGAMARPAAGAAAAGAGGKWDVVLSIAGAGDFPMTATLTQTADKVTGTISSQAGDVPVAGTFTGNALKLEFTAQTPNGDIPVTMTGTLGASGLTGKASIAGMGEADWTAKRAQ
jgi:hypothetical protein